MISFSGRRLVEVPAELSVEKAATSVDLSCNELTDLRANAFRIVGLLDLDLSSNGFDRFPIVLTLLTSLTRLCMADNKLTSGLSSKLELLPLRRLELAHNKICSIGRTIGMLTELEMLDVSDNELRDVPSEIGRLVKLREADFSSNHISAIHRNLSMCTELRILKVSKNQLETYPCSICGLRKLEYLDMSHNHLVALQGRVFEWSGLRHLDVSHNKIFVLPSALGWLELEVLNVAENPRLCVPPQVLSVCPGQLHAIRTYLQVVCEQHRLIDNHLTQFNTKPGQGMPTNHILADPRRTFSARHRRREDYTNTNSTMAAFQRAAQDRILDLRCCGLATLPDVPKGAHQWKIRVLDTRYNWLKTAAPTADNEGLVILNVAHNQLTKLVDSAARWEQLAVLSASFNSLAALPSDIGSAKRLQQIYISGNQLTALPNSLSTLPLVDLFLAENKLTQLPSCICRLTAICKLSLACNDLTVLPSGLGSLASLQFLDVSFNKISVLPPDLSRLSELEALSLAFNPIGKLSGGQMPSPVLQMTALKELNLDFTGCREMDLQLGQLASLQALKLDGNDLQQPWLALYQMNPLLLVQIHSPVQQVLNLHACGLDELPACMALMRSLEELDLSDNHLRTLPRLLSELPCLRAIRLDGNPLESHLAKVLEKGNQQGPGEGEGALIALLTPSISVLSLTGLSLHACPPEVLWHSACLKSLDLAQNALTALPDSMSCCRHLERLILKCNKLVVVPDTLFSLASLRVLDLCDNRIDLLPGRISQLTALQMLLVGNNSLRSLGAGFASLRKLVGLSAHTNVLAMLPEEIAQLHVLRILDVSGNQLTAIPDGLSRLTRLQSLRVSSNSLSAIPLGLCSLPKLSDLAVRGNPVADGVEEPNAHERAQVEALLVELLRLQALTSTKHRSIGPMSAKIASAPSLHSRQPVQSATPSDDASSEPQSVRAAARSEHLAQSLLQNLMTKLDEVELSDGEESVDQDALDSDVNPRHASVYIGVAEEGHCDITAQQSHDPGATAGTSDYTHCVSDAAGGGDADPGRDILGAASGLPSDHSDDADQNSPHSGQMLDVSNAFEPIQQEAIGSQAVGFPGNADHSVLCMAHDDHTGSSNTAEEHLSDKQPDQTNEQVLTGSLELHMGDRTPQEDVSAGHQHGVDVQLGLPGGNPEHVLTCGEEQETDVEAVPVSTTGTSTTVHVDVSEREHDMGKGSLAMPDNAQSQAYENKIDDGQADVVKSPPVSAGLSPEHMLLSLRAALGSPQFAQKQQTDDMWDTAGASHGVRPIPIVAVTTGALETMPADELLEALNAPPKPPPLEGDDAKTRRPKVRARAARVAASQMARLDLLIQANAAASHAQGGQTKLDGNDASISGRIAG
eukprot:jgi/Ulvmu1/8462/UM043_0042.1